MGDSQGMGEKGSDPSRATGYIILGGIPLRERGQTPFPLSLIPEFLT
jgi:hypothetical protein